MICSRRGCTNEVPQIAIDNDDTHCSTECAKVVSGVMTLDELNETRRREKGDRKKPIKHGTVHAYQKYGCKCQECLAAGRAYSREKYYQKKAREAALDADNVN